MTDVHTPEQRSRNMAAIKGKNTKPEIMLRKMLWNKGLRYRLKSKLPGKPDLVFSSAKIVVFIDGCFWHQCPQHYKMPSNNRKYWSQKITGNVTRDARVTKELRRQGWIVMRFWEHEVKKDGERVVRKILKTYNVSTRSPCNK